MKTLEAKPFNQNAETWKRENREFIYFIYLFYLLNIYV